MEKDRGNQRVFDSQSGVPILHTSEDLKAEELAKQTQEALESGKSQAIASRRGVALTATIALLTLITTLVSIFQARVTARSTDAAVRAADIAERSLADQRLENALAAGLAKASLEETIRNNNLNSDISRRSLQAQIENFHEQQRAYLVPDEPKNSGGFGLLRLPIRNFGHATAERVVMQFAFERFDSESMRKLDQRAVKKIADEPIVPGDVATFEWQIFIPIYAEDINRNIGSGKEVVRLIGKITYDDGFENNRDVRFCYFFQKIASKWENCSLSQSIWLSDFKNAVTDASKP